MHSGASEVWRFKKIFCYYDEDFQFYHFFCVVHFNGENRRVRWQNILHTYPQWYGSCTAPDSVVTQIHRQLYHISAASNRWITLTSKTLKENRRRMVWLKKVTLHALPFIGQWNVSYLMHTWLSRRRYHDILIGRSPKVNLSQIRKNFTFKNHG